MSVTESFVLKDTISYQQGSVVSKTLTKRSGGTVTLFAFDKGQGLSEHTAPFEAWVHVLDGLAEIKIGGESTNVKSGEMIRLPENVPHALNAIEPFKMLLIMVRELS